MVLASLGVLEVRELGMLEVWLSKLVEFLVVELASYLSVQLVSCVSCMVGNILDDTLQAIAVFEADSLLMAAVMSNRPLLLVDKILDLPELTPEVVQLIKFLLDARMWLHTVGRLKSFRIRIADDLIWNGKIRLDVHDLGDAGLSEEDRETDILHGLSIDGIGSKLHQLRIRHTVDLDAVE